jgi:hypothetical protein
VVHPTGVICLLQQVLDYRQYYLDLNASNMRNVTEWLSEYNLTEYYGLNEVSANELHNLVESFQGHEGTSLFHRCVIWEDLLHHKYLIWFRSTHFT